MIVPDLLAFESFEAAALQRFAEHYRSIAAYGAYCDAKQRTPASVRTLSDVPLMPVTAFKTAVLQTQQAAAAPVCVFETSGTTDGRPGTVRLSDPAHYDAALHATFEYFVLPDAPGPMRCISLVPTTSTRPCSSLGHMVQALATRYGDGQGGCFIGPAAAQHGAVDVDGLHGALQTASSDGTSTLILTTTIALDMAARQWPHGTSLRLPPGSRLMDTGGPKGSATPIDRQALLRRISALWGLESALCVGELGMTELGSQRYETTARAHLVGDVAPSRTYAGPPWLRSVVLDPLTMREVPEGVVGIVGHLDLANVQTCAFILTSDLGRIVNVNGAGATLELWGRVPGSQLRGCGLDAESL